MYNVHKLPYDGHGLKWRPSLEPEYSDDADMTPLYVTQLPRPADFSVCNQRAFIREFGKVKHYANAVLEIGVDRPHSTFDNSSTYRFFTEKLDHTKYIGIDIEDKSELDDTSKNIFTLKTDSANVKHVMNFCNSLGVKEFDFIFIDGWHSVNQVMYEWEYTTYLRKGGCVAFHDTYVHPGPYCVFDAISEETFDKIEECGCSTDWGISFAWKK